MRSSVLGTLAVFVAVSTIWLPTTGIADGCPANLHGTFSLTSSHKYSVLHGHRSSDGMVLELKPYKVSPNATYKHAALEVNSDGSPRAYHLLDPEGKGYALNDMYSGGVRVYRNGKEIDPTDGPTAYKLYYDTFRTMVVDNESFGIQPSGYKAEDDSTYGLGGDFGLGLDEPRGVTEAEQPPPSLEERPRSTTAAAADHYLHLKCKHIDCSIDFPNNIFLYESGKLCIRSQGRYAGFLVNRLTVDGLQTGHVAAGNPADPENAEDTTCGSVINVDAEKLPGLVLPGRGLHVDGTDAVVHFGDIVIAYNDDRKSWVFGIFSDGGPGGNMFGEASIGFNRILKGGGYLRSRIPRPQKYRRDGQNDRSPTVLTLGIDTRVSLLVLPGSANAFKEGPHANGKYDFSPETVAERGKVAFVEWAKAKDLDEARATFRDCLSVLHRQ